MTGSKITFDVFYWCAVIRFTFVLLIIISVFSLLLGCLNCDEVRLPACTNETRYDLEDTPPGHNQQKSTTSVGRSRGARTLVLNGQWLGDSSDHRGGRGTRTRSNQQPATSNQHTRRNTDSGQEGNCPAA